MVYGACFMKIQIIAFPRSGTTLMKRTVESHPDVRKIFFETLLLRKRSKEQLIKKYPVFSPGINCGEKNIYAKPYFGKGRPKSPTDMTPLEYCKKWNKFFGKEARIIQIVRHPFDVWNSILLKRYIKQGRQDSAIRNLKLYFESFPKYIQQIDRMKNCMTLKYEDLILNFDDKSSEIYSFCNLSTNHINIRSETMRTGRVFAHEKRGLVIRKDKRINKYHKEFSKIMNNKLPELIEILNKFPGPKYKYYEV